MSWVWRGRPTCAASAIYKVAIYFIAPLNESLHIPLRNGYPLTIDPEICAMSALSYLFTTKTHTELVAAVKYRQKANFVLV